jgi:hypothetical protein
VNPNGCIHWTGTQTERRKEGIDFRALVGGEQLGWCTRLPCIALEAKGGAKAVCAKFRKPTAEEVTESKARSDEALRRLMVAYTGKVREWREAQGWSKKNRVAATGKVACDVCKTGEIHLTMAAYNGHVWGKCTTDGCVSWLE